MRRVYTLYCTNYAIIYLHLYVQLLLHHSQGDKKKSQYQTSLQQEFSFYWLNLSLQEDSCIAKTEPDTSSSAVVVYSLKLHQNQDAFDVTEKTLELHYSTLRYGWGEEAAATDSAVQTKKKGRGHIP